MQPVAQEALFFHEHLAERHVDAPLDLALHQEWVQCSPDVVRQPDPVDGEESGVRVTGDFGDAR